MEVEVTSPVHESAENVENVARRCAQCADCEGKLDDVSAGVPSWENIRRLESVEELRAFPGLTTSDEKHTGITDDTLAWYDLGEFVECSLKGRHLHAYGIVQKTLCGLTLNMGKVCGKKSIINFDQLMGDVRRRTGFHSDLVRVAQWPQGFEVRLAEIRPRLDALRRVWTQLDGLLPDVLRELERRRKLEARGLEVQLPYTSSEEDAKRGPARLAGLAILDAPHHRSAELQTRLEKFRGEHASTHLDRAGTTKLQRLATQADKALEAARAWSREAAEFITESNLRLVAIAMSFGTVESTPEGISVSFQGSRIVVFPRP